MMLASPLALAVMLVRIVVADGAARRGAEHGVVVREVAGHTAD